MIDLQEKKQILILTSDTGFGHRSASNAVADALAECYWQSCQTDVINPIIERPAPYFLRNSMRDYDKTVRSSPSFYRFTYEAINLPVIHTVLEGAFTAFLYKGMRAILDEFCPDAVLSTYHIFNAPVGAALARAHASTPFYTVVTDLSAVHKCWFQPSPDKFFVPTAAVRNEAISEGIPAEKIVISGIPVNPEIAREKRKKADIRMELGWDPGRTTILAVGSRRVSHLIEHLEAIDRCAFPVQLVIVAGGDDVLYRQTKAIAWRIPVHIYNFVENLPTMMRASDLLISKAGGLIIAEGLACGIPAILIDYIPGQETGNIAYVCDQQVGILAKSPSHLLTILDDWLQDGASKLNRFAVNSGRAGKPEAAYQVAKILWQAVQNQPKGLIK
ncbi:MAG TPA: glycosyltransferase [Anaerolineales bacterium]